MKIVTFTNTFHNNKVLIRIDNIGKDNIFVLTVNQIRRLRSLCGMRDCACGCIHSRWLSGYDNAGVEYAIRWQYNSYGVGVYWVEVRL